MKLLASKLIDLPMSDYQVVVNALAKLPAVALPAHDHDHSEGETTA